MLSIVRQKYSEIVFFLVLLFAVAVLAYIGCTFKLDNTRLTFTDPVVFTEGWSVRTDAGLTPLDVPDRAAAGVGRERFTIETDLPAQLGPDSCLCVNTKNERVTAEINGVCIYTFGENDRVGFGGEFGAVWNLIPLPVSAAGQRISLTFIPRGGRTGESPYPILLGSRNAVILELLQEKSGLVVVCLLLFTIAIYSLLTSLLFVLRHDTRAPSTFYFGMFVLLCAIWATADGLLLQLFSPNKAFSYLLFCLSFYMLSIPFCLFMANTVAAYARFFRNAGLVASAYFILRVVLYLFGVLDFEAGLSILHLYMGCMILSSLIALCVPVLRHDSQVEPEMVVGIVVLLLWEVYALVSFYVHDRLDVQRAGYASDFYFGILLYALIVSFGMVRRNSRLVRQAYRTKLYEQRAFTDDLTGLLSCRGFDDKAPGLISSYPSRAYAVVDFDVNFFDQYNANNGFEAGNELLLRIRDLIVQQRLEGELAARLEADHFVLLMYGAELSDVIARLHASDADLRRVVSRSNILISYGVAEARDRTLPITVLRNQAATAKRTIKGNYENNLAVFDRALHERQMESLLLSSTFETGLQNGKYVPFFQPKIDLATGRIVGAEALTRRQDDGKVFSLPPNLIPLLESNGLIKKLDMYMFEQVCRFQCAQRALGRRPVPISVNFSRSHLYDGDFAGQLAAVAARYAVPCEMLEVELTESVFFASRDLLKTVFDALRAQGFRVSIDDFGSGYSSLNMLKEVVVDAVKIDKAFLDSFEDNRRTRTVLSSVIRLTQELEITSVAEGVETEAQIGFLRGHGCNVVQGYYYSPPLPEDAFVERYLAGPETDAPAPLFAAPTPACE